MATGLPNVPKCYESQLSKTNTKILDAPPIVDLGGIEDPMQRPILVQQVANACCRHGFFQVINHGIPREAVEGALSAASGFFNLATEEKAEYMSGDVRKPVRYVTSVNDGEEVDQVQYWRVFLKHYAHPLDKWVNMWPQNPPDYKEKMGECVVAIQNLASKMMGVVTESLGLGATFLSSKMEEGMQVMAVNSYPAGQQALGLPPHTDYGCLTVVLQDSPGLQVWDTETRSWTEVPPVEDALQVHVGDQLEVLTNGRYKSVVHRVVLGNSKPRMSIAALHAMGMDVKVGAAAEMVDELHPNGYRESSFGDFLDFIANNDLGKGSGFLDTLKISQK